MTLSQRCRLDVALDAVCCHGEILEQCFVLQIHLWKMENKTYNKCNYNTIIIIDNYSCVVLVCSYVSRIVLLDGSFVVLEASEVKFDEIVACSCIKSLLGLFSCTSLSTSCSH